ncbi:MAG: putative Zn-dependent protease [Myxococcota bacterium]|jgi:predicted Zn-dependent protease
MIGILSLLLPAQADDVLVDALSTELDANMATLRLEDAAAPYFISYLAYDVQNTTVTAQLGGLLVDDSRPSRQLGVGVRVGDAQLDSANFEALGESDGFTQRRLVRDDVSLAIQHDAWLVTDTAYKAAVENLSRKEALARRRIAADETPDFAPGPAQQADNGAAPPVDAAAFRTQVRDLSSIFLDHPEIESSTVYGAAEVGRRIMIDSLGTRVIEPTSEICVRVVARTRSADGATLVDEVAWIVRSLDDLPPADAMAAEVAALAQRLSEWRDLPAAESEYIGPVVFADGAAVDLFRHLMLPALEGTPSPEAPPRGSRVISFDSGGSSALGVRRRMLPVGFTVHDDPTADLSLPSSFRYDWEGEPASRVDLVVDGIVRSHYAARTPSAAVPATNGHGRGFPGSLVRGMASHTVVAVEREDSARKLHRQAMKLTGAYDNDHYLIVRRLSDPGLSGNDVGAMFMFGGDDDGGLPAPIEVLRVYADGHEEPVRGLNFAGSSISLLRDIVAASGETTETFLTPPPRRGYQGQMFGLPVTLTAPDVLVGELELVAGTDAAERPSRVGSPLVEGR